MWVIYLASAVIGQYVAWSLTSRLMWRNYYNQGTDRKGAASFCGFFWPVVLLVFMVTGALKPALWAQTAQSLGERKTKRREAKQARLRDLDKQIERAEAELEATGHAAY